MQQHNWDKDWLEKMYNNRAMVSNSPEILERLAIKSKQARTQLMAEGKAFLDIPYGEGKNDTLDIFTPSTPSPDTSWPVVFFIHGGYWYALDKSDHSLIAPPLVEQGICVVIVNYTLCPEVTVPDIIEQNTRALAWVNQHIADYGGNSQRITVTGHSVGGHATAMMMTRPWQHYLATETKPFRNALAISGLFDIEPLSQTPFLQKIGITDEQIATMSPVRLSPTVDAPLTCVVGGKESPEFLRQNDMLKPLWGAHISVTSAEIKGEDHFTIVEDSLGSKDGEVAMMLIKLAHAV